MKPKKGGWKWRIQLREAVLGVTASSVAKAAGMTPSTYHALVNSTNATTKTLERVADALGVTLSWLLKESGKSELAKEAAEMKPPEWLKKRAVG